MGRFTTPLSVAVVASVASALRPSTRRSPSIRRAVATETMIKEEGGDENWYIYIYIYLFNYSYVLCLCIYLFMQEFV